MEHLKAVENTENEKVKEVSDASIQSENVETIQDEESTGETIDETAGDATDEPAEIVPDTSMQETLSKELSVGMFKFHESFGYDSAKRANLHLFPAVEDAEGAVIMYAAGNLLILKNLSSGEKTIIRSPAGSVGALAVNHDHSYFAIGGKGVKPPILVYSYPDLK